MEERQVGGRRVNGGEGGRSVEEGGRREEDGGWRVEGGGRREKGGGRRVEGERIGRQERDVRKGHYFE